MDATTQPRRLFYGRIGEHHVIVGRSGGPKSLTAIICGVCGAAVAIDAKPGRHGLPEVAVQPVCSNCCPTFL